MDKGRRVWVERIGHGSSFCEIDFGELYTTFWHCKVDITSRIPSFPNPIPKSKLSLFLRMLSHFELVSSSRRLTLGFDQPTNLATHEYTIFRLVCGSGFKFSALHALRTQTTCNSPLSSPPHHASCLSSHDPDLDTRP